jgi:hypothetical protein
MRTVEVVEFGFVVSSIRLAVAGQFIGLGLYEIPEECQPAGADRASLGDWCPVAACGSVQAAPAGAGNSAVGDATTNNGT